MFERSIIRKFINILVEPRIQLVNIVREKNVRKYNYFGKLPFKEEANKEFSRGRLPKRSTDKVNSLIDFDDKGNVNISPDIRENVLVWA